MMDYNDQREHDQKMIFQARDRGTKGLPTRIHISMIAKKDYRLITLTSAMRSQTEVGRWIFMASWKRLMLASFKMSPICGSWYVFKPKRRKYDLKILTKMMKLASWKVEGNGKLEKDI